MNKYNRFMEYFWLVAGVSGALFAVFMVLKYGYEGNAFLSVFPIMALMMFFLRRMYRKQVEKKNNSKS